MKTNNGEVFLSKIGQRIKNGDFDTYLTVPLQTRELFFASLKSKMVKKISVGGSAVLSDNEIKECIKESEDTAIFTINLYFELGFIEKGEDGINITEKGYSAIKESYNINN